jgi:hypothetical protein
MSFNAIRRAGVAIAALGLFSIAPMTATAASDNAARHSRFHHAHRAVYRGPAAHRGERVAEGDRLPYAPEYGFLSRVPPNAIRMPGYIFVPGHGILGASCDLPSSACSNQYRDIQ